MSRPNSLPSSSTQNGRTALRMRVQNQTSQSTCLESEDPVGTLLLAVPGFHAGTAALLTLSP